MKFLEMFIEDCKYYDPENIEVKTIMNQINLKGKTVLDIGAGIGRLSFPLAKFAKEVIALDKDKRLQEYFKKYKKENVKFVNQEAESYLKDAKKFDIIILAWPTIPSNIEIIDLIESCMHQDSLFIFITCDNNSDFETIVDKLNIIKKGYFDKDIANKIRFMKLLPKKFKLITKKKLKTQYIYPNEKIAFRILKNSMKLWFNIKLNKKSEINLKKLINKHDEKGKIIFGEEIWFYLLKLK